MSKKKVSITVYIVYAVYTAFAALIFYFLFALSFVNRVLPNTYMGSFSIGGMDEGAVIKQVSERIDAFESSKIKFLVGGTEIEVLVKDLGVKYDREGTAYAIANDGYGFKLWVKLNNLGNSLFKARVLYPRYTVDFDVLSASLQKQLLEFEVKPVDASLQFKEEMVVAEGSNGNVVDYTSLVERLRSHFDTFSDDPVQIDFFEKEPRIKAPMLTKIFEKYRQLEGKKIVFSHGFDSWTMTSDEVFGLLKVDILGFKEGYIARTNLIMPIVLTDFAFEEQSLEARIFVSAQKIAEFFEPIAKAIDRPTVDATFRFEDGRIYEFTPAIDGQKLDLDTAVASVESKVSVDNLENDKVISLKLPVAVTTAKVANEKINALGIRELIGRGISYFSGSIANRAYNIQLGAGRISGTLVAPGEVYSFNSAVGEVSGKTGYRQAYVISSGRTVLDDGGGICQVSTTLFRAALNAGLPIVSRTGHAYRVGYYEQRGFGPGLDATVWAPSVDFTFKNDTAHHILVQTVYDASKARLEIDLYGTSDGRRVEMSDPAVTSLVRPPPEMRQDDPTLLKGTVKQVDFAAWGAQVYFTRKVYKADQLILDDIFRTNYRPWQAIYLVGTGG